VHVESLVTLQPVLNFGVLVRGMVIDDQMASSLQIAS
jgi:hypothetical protein